MPIWRYLLPLLLCCLVAVWSPSSGASVESKAAGVLRLDTSLTDVDAWPAVSVYAEPDGELDAAAMLQRQGSFEPPTGPHANFGVRRDAVWLRLAVDVDAADDGRWMLDIDYPSLDRIDVVVVENGQIRGRHRLGDAMPFADRPLPSRSHALALALTPGAQTVLLLRVQTTSSMIVPLRLVKAQAFHAGEARMQLLQGLAAGIGLCLVMYALSQWLGTRETMFLHYATTVAGVTMFFFAYYGLAPQHLWPQQAWLTGNMAPLAVLFGLGGSMLLIERLLDIRAFVPLLARALYALAVIAFASAALFLIGVLDYRQAHLMGTVLGPLPMLLAIPVAWLRWRGGDRAALYIFAGWGMYAVGVGVMAALLRGGVGSNAWTQHAFQAGTMCEALMWLRVLGMRNDEARQRAARAEREHEMLQALAHTDPLTGLPNRRGLEQALAAALPQVGAQQMMAVYMVDLDGFKAVNDRLGHDVGDALLVAVAGRIRAQLRHADMVARLGGDEFVVLAHGMSGEADAWQLGRKLVTAFREPFNLAGSQCSVGLTVGFAMAPLDGSDATGLLKRADAAMYAGKQSGKGVVLRGGASAGLSAA